MSSIDAQFHVSTAAYLLLDVPVPRLFHLGAHQS